MAPDAAKRGAAANSLLEIARVIEIREQTRLLGLPAQQHARSLTRGLIVERGKMREPGEVVGGFFWRHADDRHVEAPADHRGDVAEGDAFFGVAVIAPLRGACLAPAP